MVGRNGVTLANALSSCILLAMRPRTRITLPNPSESEFENFDRFVRVVLSKPKPLKDAKAKGQPAGRRLPRP